MGTCGDTSSSLRRPRYVSWCVDTPACVAAADPDRRSAGSGSIPLVVLPPETRGGETAFPPGPPRPTLTLNPDGGRGNLSPENPSPLLHPEVQRFLLPRSSPVISKHHRPISWHGGDTDPPDPPSSDCSGSLSADQHGRPMVASMEDLRSRPGSSPKQGHVSGSSNLNPPAGGGQGLAEGHRGRRPASCEAPPTQGLSTSTKRSKPRSCSSFPEFCADVSRTSCELDQENAHFVVVDMVLEVLEGVKWTLTSRTDPRSSGSEGAESRRSHEAPQRRTNGGAEEEGAANISPRLAAAPTPGDSLRNAERLAQQLVLEFRRRWLPSREPRRGRQSLRTSLQELPGTGSVAVSGGSLTEEIWLRTRMRGSLSWAPPRLQLIFTVQPTLRRSEVVASQHFLCAGCGTEVEPRYIKKLRYCDYLGRYFCDCCHSGAEAVIPARVLSSWDFGRYPVSDFSKQLLDSVWREPLFDLTCVGKTLGSRVKELDKFGELQEQLLGIRKLLNACRLSGRATAEFKQLPAHLIREPPTVFSMDDLLRAKKGQLVAQARAALQAAVDHVEKCELCQARGFICEFCREGGVIFPFQRDVCRRCPACKACFHKHCFVERKCPKCARRRAWGKPADGSAKCDG